MRVVLTGAAGMLGSNIVEQWVAQRPGDELIALTRSTVDLRDADAPRQAIRNAQPDAIIHAAARVAGIAEKLAHPATFLQENLQLDSSVISAAIAEGIPELLYISSGAIYPADLRQPLVEEDLLTGPLEEANEGYAIAKITGSELCAYASRQFGYSYRAAVPSNLCGPGDDFTPGRAHLIASAISKMHDAVDSGAGTVSVWGDGTARREFTYSGDLAGWLVGQVGSFDTWPELLNLDIGHDDSIREYYEAAARVVGFTGAFQYDTSKPSGVMQRLLDSSKARALGWNPQTGLDEGFPACYASYLAARENEE